MKNVPKSTIHISTVSLILLVAMASCKPTGTVAKTQKQPKISVLKPEKHLSDPRTIHNIPKIVLENDNLSPFPPPAVASSFKNSYPIFSQLAWTKIPSTLLHSATNTYTYKADFRQDNIENTATYSETGQWIESKVKILPEQLPQNIYDAIKKKYPDAQIISAFTYKSSKINATYWVIIQTLAPVQQKELTINENGTFVE